MYKLLSFALLLINIYSVENAFVRARLEGHWECSPGRKGRIANITQVDEWRAENTCTTNCIDKNEQLDLTVRFLNNAEQNLTAKVLAVTVGNRAYAAVGWVISGCCKGAIIVNIVVYCETERDCRRERGLKRSVSEFNEIVIFEEEDIKNGKRRDCGLNYCSGSEVIYYNPGLPYSRRHSGNRDPLYE